MRDAEAEEADCCSSDAKRFQDVCSGASTQNATDVSTQERDEEGIAGIGKG